MTIAHPEGLYCPICGCGSIIFWAEVLEWESLSEEEKRSYEVCAACGCISGEEEEE